MIVRRKVTALLSTLVAAVAIAGLTGAGSGQAAQQHRHHVTSEATALNKPHPQPFYICGGEGDVLCQSNSKIHGDLHGSLVEICYFSNTPCQEANHILVAPKGHIGEHGFQPLRHHGDQKFFHGREVVILKWMRYNRREHRFQGTGFCEVPALGPQNGAHVVLESCSNKSLGNRTRALWILFPLTQVGYPTNGINGIANVYECNKHDGSGHLPVVMSSLFRDHPGERRVYMLPLSPNNSMALFHQAWDLTRAGIK